MEFGQAVRKCMIEKYYPLIEGRAARSEFWWFMLFYWLVSMGFFMVIGLVFAAAVGPALVSGGEPSPLVLVLVIPFYLAIIVFGFFMMPPIVGAVIRRLHDRDMSGWWYLWMSLLSLIPFVGFGIMIWMLVLMLLPGTQGPNRFGGDPRAPQGNIFS